MDSECEDLFSGTIMAEVLVRARALVVIARDVLYLDDLGHTL